VASAGAELVIAVSPFVLAESILMPVPHKDPHIARLLHLPEFPKTPDHAATLINIARSLRQGCSFQKAAMEHIVYQRRAELQALLQDAPDDDELHNLARRDLQSCQEALDRAVEESAIADRDFSEIRSLLRRRNLPTHFPFEPNLPHFSQSPSNSLDDDDDDGSSCWGV
jgi:hypothetical protein